MRVVHLDSSRTMRGGQWQVLRLVQATGGALLARAGSPLFERAKESGVAVQPLSLARVASLSLKADLVHAHDARSHALAAVASRCPFVVSRRVAFPVKQGPLSRWKYRRAARYIAVSGFVKEILMDGGVAAENVSVVYDGVPLLEPSTRRDGLLTIPSPDPMKGSGIAIEAARLAGLRLDLSTSLEADLATAGVLVYLSHSEGLGSGILLAMSAGIPVIASRTGGIPEAVEHEGSGLLTENTPEAVALAIRKLSGDAALCERFARRARQIIEEKFSTEKMVHDTLAVYRKVLA